MAIRGDWDRLKLRQAFPQGFTTNKNDKRVEFEQLTDKQAIATADAYFLLTPEAEIKEQYDYEQFAKTSKEV